MAEAQATVRFGPRERRGLVAGWRAPQLAVVVLGLLAAIALARFLPGAAAAVVCPVVAASCVAVATLPLRGRTIEQWAPMAITFTARRSYRRAPLRLPVTALQLRRPPRAVARVTGTAGISLEELAVGPRAALGVLVDARRQRVTVASYVRSQGGALALGGADPIAVRAWGNLLRSATRPGSPVERVQWAAWCEQGRAEGDLDRKVLLATTVAYGRRRPRGEAVALALREQLGYSRFLVDAGVVVEDPLDAAGFATALALDGGTYPWPLAIRESWDHVVVDGLHAKLSWVEEWPRVDRELGFLSPLLLASPSARVSVTFEPIGPLEAARRLEQERTASMADEEVKRRGGFLSTMRRQRELEGAVRREAELADGEGLLSFSGYTLAVGEDLESVDLVQETLEEAAARSGMALRLLHGEQAPAFALMLALGRGPRG